MASHFPDHAFLYSTKVLLLKSGRLYAAGTPEEVITEQNLERLYGVNVKIVNTGVQNNSRGKSGGGEVKVCVPVLCAS
jgi:iron complex transport system ATP-binding protein/manganese/iron transport system ATP-binding protein